VAPGGTFALINCNQRLARDYGLYAPNVAAFLPVHSPVKHGRFLPFRFLAIYAIGWRVISVGWTDGEAGQSTTDLLLSALEDIIDLAHPLVRFAREINCSFLESRD
jgi:hypothetical protein